MSRTSAPPAESEVVTARRARRALLEAPEAAIALLHVPAPDAPADALFAADPGDDGFLWAPPDAPEHAGSGSVHTLRAEGPDRFASIREQARALWPRLSERGLGVASAGLRLFGGFSFQSGRAAQPPWHGFGEARFALPRLAYARLDGQPILTLAVTAEERATASRLGALLDAFEERLAGLERAARAAPLAPSTPRALRSLDTLAPGHWTTLVESIRAGIGAGRFEKVVAARRAVLELEPPASPLDVLDRLRSVAPECTRFAFRRGATFLGATPERLLRKRGLLLETEALAGSIRPGGPANESRLLASGKDHHEHELVVRDLLRCLEPISRSLEYSGQPRIQALRHVLHLRTPVQATLREPRHVLDLVARLHPTPAVGGVPTAAALDWIAANEPHDRGWYAGPVGWFDQSGDGDFVVALRSGVVESERVHLFAGAGIVADSDAAAEYAETELKLAALLDALDVSAS